ncbi:MAG: SPOR domain-containing protein [Acidovorax sp.]
MLRIAVLVLFLANAGYFAWTHGWLGAAQKQTEPERLEQQIHPEALQVLPPPAPAASAPAPAPAPAPVPASAPAAAPPAPAAAPTECLQAGPFDERQAETLRSAAAALPRDAWTLASTVQGGRWMVYIGRLADAEAVEKKRAELRARSVAYDRPGAAFEPGLSLGRYSSEEAARRALADLGKQGVRTAHVVLDRPETRTYTLRLPAVDGALRPQLGALKPALAGKPLHACN